MCKLKPMAGQTGAGAHPQLDEALALGVGGQDDLVHDAALAVPQRAADVLLREALRRAGGVVRQRRRLAHDHISLRPEEYSAPSARRAACQPGQPMPIIRHDKLP